MKPITKAWVLLAFITLFSIGVVVRYPFVEYPPANTDTFTYVFMTGSIINTFRIPWLLHPVLSFFGLYPASDTSGPMVLIAATYSVCGVPTLFNACTIIDFFMIILFILSGFLISAYVTKNKLIYLLPSLFILVCPTFVLESNFFTVGSRLLAVMFFMCYFLCLFLVLFKHQTKKKKAKIFILALALFTGGISSHLMGIFFAFFLIFPFILTPILSKLSNIVTRNIPNKLILKYRWLLLICVFGLVLLIVYMGWGPVKFKEFYAAEQSLVYKIRALGPLGEHPFIMVFLLYFFNIGYFIPLSFIGVYSMLKRGVNKRVKNFFTGAVCLSLLFLYETGYFPYVTTIILVMLSIIGVEYILKNKENILIILFVGGTLILSMVFYFFHSGFVEPRKSYYAFMCGVLILLTFILLFIYIAIKNKNLSKQSVKNKLTSLTLACLLVFCVAYGTYNSNIDLAGDAEKKVLQVPHYPPYPLIDTAYYSKFVCDSKRVLFSTYGGNTQFSALSGKTLYVETMTEEPKFVQNLTILPVETYDYYRPKTLYTAKSSDFPNIQGELSGQVIIMYTFFNSPSTTHEARKKYEIDYTVEFLPYEGQYVSYGFKWTSANSIFLKELKNRSYVTFMNSQFRMYYSY